MRKIIYLVSDIVIGVVIGVIITVFIHDQLVEKQSIQQELQEKQSQQFITKAITLMDGDEAIIKRAQIKFPVKGESYAVLHNDARGFTKEVYFGDSPDMLHLSIGQYMKSGIPGQGKPILLAGHNTTHFKLLPSFEVGDHVQMDTAYGSFLYEVTHMETILADDFDSEQLQKEEEYLIMYCCYPFDSLSTDYRYFVYAKKIQGPMIEGEGTWKE